MMTEEEQEEKFAIIGRHLSPENPIRSQEHLRGRARVLEDAVRELRHFKASTFIYGFRGVGKTSLATTAAQLVTPSDRQPVYVACVEGSSMLQIFREIGEGLLKILLQLGKGSNLQKKVEIELSLNPAIRASFEKSEATLPPFSDVSAAIRVLKDLDSLMPQAESTVVVLDELEVLTEEDRKHLAAFVKQVGDQDFRIRFVLVGIAGNVHELIGIHASIPRYLREVSLQPLKPQDLMDIVTTAADAVNVSVPRGYLFRVAIIGNGFPHFAHLMGKSMLIEAVLADSATVTSAIYKSGVIRAVEGSNQELKISYEAATQRGGDHYKHLIWALANSDVVDIRNDEWVGLYYELANKHGWKTVELTKLRNAIGNFKSKAYGQIITSTPARYGDEKTRHRYKRFNNMLMRGHVRLQAELEGVTLGREPGM